MTESARRAELTEAAYAYVVEHGLAGASLRPVAEAIGSSTGVLRFLLPHRVAVGDPEQHLAAESGLARHTVRDWLDLLGRAQPAAVRRTAAGRAQRTAVLAVLRGGMLDLLATSDRTRVDRAARYALEALTP